MFIHVYIYGKYKKAQNFTQKTEMPCITLPENKIFLFPFITREYIIRRELQKYYKLYRAVIEYMDFYGDIIYPPCESDRTVRHHMAAHGIPVAPQDKAARTPCAF